MWSWNDPTIVYHLILRMVGVDTDTVQGEK